MEMERVMAQMLAKMKAEIRTSQQDLREEIRTNQAQMDANLREMRAGQELLIEKMPVKLYGCYERMMARMGSWLEKMEFCLRKTEAMDLEVNPEEMKSIAVH
jgi:hypothetical protein